MMAFGRNEMRFRSDTIYFDNAATTWPKPPEVMRALSESVCVFGANPGRGSYEMANDTAMRVFECRKRAADFFGIAEPERVIFTPGCTWSINTVLKGYLCPGDHIVISDLEHNAVVRPIERLCEQGVTCSRAHVVEGDDDATVENFRAALRSDTRMVFCTDASNVFGIRLPTARIAKLCRGLGIRMGIDAAQSVGIVPIDAVHCGADFVCMPAHKGLYGTAGLGLLLLCGDAVPLPLAEGGTGSLSALRTQPEELPDRLESGTLNVPAICALNAGLGAIGKRGTGSIAAHEYAMAGMLYEMLSDIPGVLLYTAYPRPKTHVPLISFGIKGMDSEEAATKLAQRHIAVRGGFHCAYDAHMAMHTQKCGTVRASLSMFTTENSVRALVRAVRAIAAES